MLVSVSLLLFVRSDTTDNSFNYDGCLVCLGYPTVSLNCPLVADEAGMNNQQASYLVSIHLIFVLLDTPVTDNRDHDILTLSRVKVCQHPTLERYYRRDN